MIPILFSHNLNWAAVFLSLGFFFSEFTVGPMWAIPMDIAPRYSGSASGLMNTGSALAAILSPLVFGFVIDKTNNWELPFLGSIVLLFLGSIAAFWMKPGEGLVDTGHTIFTPITRCKIEGRYSDHDSRPRTATIDNPAAAQLPRQANRHLPASVGARARTAAAGPRRSPLRSRQPRHVRDRRIKLPPGSHRPGRPAR